MSSSHAWSRPLTAGQLWFICSAALALHILPLLMADMPVLDDYARQHMAINDWDTLGRPLSMALFAVLSFSGEAINLYPLPLLLAIVITGRALAQLIGQWFDTPTLSAVLVVLPLWFQPFFLQNLSYQYDSAPMALALASALWAIIVGCVGRGRWLAGALLVAIAAGFYQPGVNVFAGLAAVELIRLVFAGARADALWRLAVARAGQLLTGCALHYLTCAWMVQRNRAGLLPLDRDWVGAVYQRMLATFQLVELLLTPTVLCAGIALLLLCAFALVRQWIRRLGMPVRPTERLSLLAIVLLAILAVGVCIPGIMLLMSINDVTPRVLMGLGVLLVLTSYLAYEALGGFPRVRLLVLSMPVLFMLSFSYAYGRVMVLQQTLYQSMAQSIMHTVSSTTDLAAAQHCYLLDFWSGRLWLPAARGTLRAMPAIERIAGPPYFTLPELLPRVGIDQLQTFYDSPPLDRQQVLSVSPEPRVRGRFYDVYRVDDDVYVIMKPAPSTTLQDTP